jgi:hypothetical protein
MSPSSNAMVVDFPAPLGPRYLKHLASSIWVESGQGLDDP